jgi:hypothetical protein
MTNSTLPDTDVSSQQRCEDNLEYLYEIMRSDIDERITQYHKRNTRREFLKASFGSCVAFGLGGMFITRSLEAEVAAAKCRTKCTKNIVCVHCHKCNHCDSCVFCNPCIACNPCIMRDS